MIPLNINIMRLDKDKKKQLGKVKDLAIFETGTQNFSPDGLFSTEIFGPIGSDVRNASFGYVDIKVKIMHPLIYKIIISMKKLYKDIIEGKKYGVWDPESKDIIESTIDDGKNGFDFILKYLDKIDFDDNGSDERKYKIELIRKYTTPEYLIDSWVILPAGLRDYTVDDDGKPTEDEINTLYRKLIATVNNLENVNLKYTPSEVINTIKVKVQNITLEIYNYIETLLSGKSKFIQGKWTKRAISFGTRNVITAIPIAMTDIDTANKVSFNDTIIGIYQFLTGISPITKNKVWGKFINRIFSIDSYQAMLYDIKLGKSVYVDVEVTKKDEWLSSEGMNNILGKLAQESIRSEAIMIGEYALMAIYDDGKKIMPIFDTNTLPDEYDKKYIRAITYMELFYIAIEDIRSKYPAYITRYPVASLGGIYPSNLYVKTTTVARTVTLSMNGIESIVNEYPIIGEPYFNSVAVHSTKLAGLNADFDGDTVSVNIMYTDESIKEIKDYLANKEFYITPAGKIAHSASTVPLDLVLKHMTMPE